MFARAKIKLSDFQLKVEPLEFSIKIILLPAVNHANILSNYTDSSFFNSINSVVHFSKDIFYSLFRSLRFMIRRIHHPFIFIILPYSPLETIIWSSSYIFHRSEFSVSFFLIFSSQAALNCGHSSLLYSIHRTSLVTILN